MINATTALEAKIPAAILPSEVNWARTIAATIRIAASSSSRRRIVSRVLVERETWETAGDMEGNLVGGGVAKPQRSFPYANWGPWAGIFGVLAALFVGLILGVPGLFFTEGPKDELTTAGNIIVQAATELGFLSVPIALALIRGAKGPREVLDRLGVRRFQASAFGWMALAFVLYLAFTIFYSLVITEPKQKDIAESFGPTVIQVLLIVIAAPIAEETCFRGMLFGGLRTKLPRLAAALITGLIFGGLHALTGVSAVPPLIVFGFLLALLYEKTGSIVPGILLHMLNNSIALLGQ